MHRLIAFVPSRVCSKLFSELNAEPGDYDMLVAMTFREFRTIAAGQEPELWVLDYADLPHGEADVTDLREQTRAPILALVDSTDETKAALAGGADHDLAKPFDLATLRAALGAALSSPRRGLRRWDARHLTLDDLSVDLQLGTVSRADRVRTLTPTEWRLLLYFLGRPEEVVSRREVAAGAWGPRYAARTGQVELYVSRVRRKIEQEPRQPRLIQTVRECGYRLAVIPEEMAEEIGERWPKP